MKKALHLLAFILLTFSFNGFAGLGEPVKQIESIKDGAGMMYLFSLGNDGAVYYVRQSESHSQWCKSFVISMGQDSKAADYYKSLPNLAFKQITTNLTPEGSVVVYGLDSKGVLYSNYQSSSGPDNWLGWSSIGTDFQQIAAWKDKSQSLVALKNNESVSFNFIKITSYRVAEGERHWNGWKNLDGWNLNQLVCETSISGYKVVFALSKDGSVYHTWGKEDAWNGWVPLGGVGYKKIDVSKSSDGRLSLFAIDGNNAIYESHQITPEGSWTVWTNLGGGSYKDISSGISGAGRMTLFSLRTDIAVDHIWQNDPGGETWSNWASLGGDAEQSVKCNKLSDGRMVVFVIGGDGKVYYRWQAVPDGYWEDWGCLSDLFAFTDKLCETSLAGYATDNSNKVKIIDKNYSPTQPVTPITPTTPVNPTNNPNQPSNINVPANIPPPPPDTSLCSWSVDHWFFKKSPPWPTINGIVNHNLKIVFYYSEAEAKAIWNTPTPGINYGAKMGFAVLAALKLSGVDPTLPIWKNAKSVEFWLSTLNAKLTPAFLPDADSKMNNIIKGIDAWIRSHLCN